MELTLAPNPLNNSQQVLSVEKVAPDGFCPDKLQEYIDLIPPQEISEDIENMYNFIVGKLN